MDKTKRKQDKPIPNKIYSLTGAPGVPCIANGNTWAESEFKEKKDVQLSFPFPELSTENK